MAIVQTQNNTRQTVENVTDAGVSEAQASLFAAKQARRLRSGRTHLFMISFSRLPISPAMSEAPTKAVPSPEKT
jgi:hypothetical protein